jgi:hypothetical protein
LARELSWELGVNSGYVVLVQVTVRREMLEEFERRFFWPTTHSRAALIEKSVARCVVKQVT